MDHEQPEGLQSDYELLSEFSGEDAVVARQLLALRAGTPEALRQSVLKLDRQTLSAEKAATRNDPFHALRTSPQRPGPMPVRHPWRAFTRLVGRLGEAGLVVGLVLAVWLLLRSAVAQPATTGGREITDGTDESLLPSVIYTPDSAGLPARVFPAATGTPPLPGEVIGLNSEIARGQEETAAAYFRALGLMGDEADYEAAHALLTPELRAETTSETVRNNWSRSEMPRELLNYWSVSEGEVRASFVPFDEPEPIFWRFKVLKSETGWQIGEHGPLEYAPPSGSTPRDAVIDLLASIYGEPWTEHFMVLHEQEWQEGQVVISRLFAPPFASPPSGELGVPRYSDMAFFALEREGVWRLVNPGYWVGADISRAMVSNRGQYDVAIGTIVTPEQQAAFYGIAERYDIARLEVVEHNGARHSALIGDDRVFFLEASEVQLAPAAIFAYDAEGRTLEIRTGLEIGMLLPTIVPAGSVVPSTMPVTPSTKPVGSATVVPTPTEVGEFSASTPTPYVPEPGGATSVPTTAATGTPLPFDPSAPLPPLQGLEPTATPTPYMP